MYIYIFNLYCLRSIWEELTTFFNRAKSWGHRRTLLGVWKMCGLITWISFVMRGMGSQDIQHMEAFFLVPVRWFKFLNTSNMDIRYWEMFTFCEKYFLGYVEVLMYMNCFEHNSIVGTLFAWRRDIKIIKLNTADIRYLIAI